MDRERKGAVNPAAHQPSKAQMEEDVSIDATSEDLAWAVTRGGADRSKLTAENSTQGKSR